MPTTSKNSKPTELLESALEQYVQDKSKEELEDMLLAEVLSKLADDDDEDEEEPLVTRKKKSKKRIVKEDDED